MLQSRNAKSKVLATYRVRLPHRSSKNALKFISLPPVRRALNTIISPPSFGVPVRRLLSNSRASLSLVVDRGIPEIKIGMRGRIRKPSRVEYHPPLTHIYLFAQTRKRACMYALLIIPSASTVHNQNGRQARESGSYTAD